MGDLKIDMSAAAETNGLWQVQGPSPVMRVSTPDTGEPAASPATIDVSGAGFNDLSTAAALVFASMRPEARVSAALLERALKAYTSSHDETEPASRSAHSPAADYLASDPATASLFALQPLLSILRRPGL